MNEIVNKFLLAGDKFMPEMHLRQPQFVCNACGPFTKNKERIQKCKETEDLKYLVSDQKYDGYQRGLASMVYKFFDKKSQGSGFANNNNNNNNNKENIQLADELHKPIIKKLKKKKGVFII